MLLKTHTASAESFLSSDETSAQWVLCPPAQRLQLPVTNLWIDPAVCGLYHYVVRQSPLINIDFFSLRNAAIN